MPRPPRRNKVASNISRDAGLETKPQAVCAISIREVAPPIASGPTAPCTKSRRLLLPAFYGGTRRVESNGLAPLGSSLSRNFRKSDKIVVVRLSSAPPFNSEIEGLTANFRPHLRESGSNQRLRRCHLPSIPSAKIARRDLGKNGPAVRRLPSHPSTAKNLNCALNTRPHIAKKWFDSSAGCCGNRKVQRPPRFLSLRGCGWPILCARFRCSRRLFKQKQSVGNAPTSEPPRLPAWDWNRPNFSLELFRTREISLFWQALKL